MCSPMFYTEDDAKSLSNATSYLIYFSRNLDEFKEIPLVF